jgi:hypothetical protein
MITLHLENKIDDYDAWKAAFDKYDRAREEHHVLAYRISQPADDGHSVFIDLDFATRDDAAGFAELMEKVWRTPLAHAVSTGHADPQVRELREQQSPTR